MGERLILLLNFPYFFYFYDYFLKIMGIHEKSF